MRKIGAKARLGAAVPTWPLVQKDLGATSAAALRLVALISISYVGESPAMRLVPLSFMIEARFGF